MIVPIHLWGQKKWKFFTKHVVPRLFEKAWEIQCPISESKVYFFVYRNWENVSI